MAARLWFTPKSVRRITLRTYAVLVAKAPQKTKRIKMLCTMPLTGQKTTGFPEWLADARDFVMQHGQVVKPAETINYVNVSMGDAHLFKKKPVEAPKAKLSHFSVETMGPSDDPECVLKFQIMAPFSTDLNMWAGQMAGEEFDTTYEMVEPTGDEDDEEQQLELSGDDDADGEESDDALAGAEDGEEEDEQAGQRRRRAARQKAAAVPPPTASDLAKAKEKMQLTYDTLLTRKQ